MLKATPADKALILGTALWGWGVDRAQAFDMLDCFLSFGGIYVDCASNYPINGRAQDHGLALRWLAEWHKTHADKPFSLIVKLGAQDNLGGPQTDLSVPHLRQAVAALQQDFQSRLACVSVHWDSRDVSSVADIAVTLSLFQGWREVGLECGLSGIKDPCAYYLACPELAGHWLIQVKENFLSCEARCRYEKYFPQNRYLAYGINLGGIKSEAESLHSSVTLRGIAVDPTIRGRLLDFIASEHGMRPKPRSINDLALLYGFINPALSGLIVGPRNLVQLQDTMAFWQALQRGQTPSREGHMALRQSLCSVKIAADK